MTDFEHVTELSHLPARDHEAHKGSFGRVLVTGASRGMIGAPALAANAAFRGGAGLVTVAAPETVQLAVAALCPCATSLPLACGSGGALAAEAVGQFCRAATEADVLAVGPGLGTGDVQGRIVRAALAQNRPVVLDADGLNALPTIDNWAALRRCPIVLTPHPGEFARLVGRSVADIQADRPAAALAAVSNWTRDGAPVPVCVLKGAGTVVTDGRRLYVNDTGNPGMAVGGSGDVLTGLVGALVGQGLAPFEAACLAVNRHGRAADLAAEALGEVSLMATDLLDFLPAAMVTVQAKPPTCI